MATNTGEIIISSQPGWQTISNDKFDVRDGTVRFDPNTGVLTCAKDDMELVFNFVANTNNCPLCALTVIHQLSIS